MVDWVCGKCKNEHYLKELELFCFANPFLEGILGS